MPTKKITVDASTAGQRIDKLVAQAAGLGRSATKRLFSEGQVRKNGRRVPKGDWVAQGDEVEITLPERTSADPPIAQESSEHPLEILLETKHVVVVNKPAGQPSAPLRPEEVGTVVNGLIARYPEMLGFGFSAREPGLIHRLDNDTSGALVAARSKEAFDELVSALKAGEIDKRYWALAHDDDLPNEGEVDIPLAPHPKDRRRVLACLHPRDAERLRAREAYTDYRVLNRFDVYAEVEVSASRAFRHQIRAHLGALDCPIVGDELYGAEPHPSLGRHALHAASVTWKGSKRLPAFRVEAPLPRELRALLPTAPAEEAGEG